jgi:hypothetical protein
VEAYASALKLWISMMAIALAGLFGSLRVKELMLDRALATGAGRDRKGWGGG